MTGTPARVPLAAVALGMVVSLGTPSVAWAGGGGTLRSDVAAVRDSGAIGVQARLRVGGGRAVTATAGVAVLGSGRPVVPGGWIRMGSVTKAFVSTVVLQLAGEGRLALDDTVERWLPGVVAGNGNDGRRITLRQLLNHTGGTGDDGFPAMDSAADYYRHRYDRRVPERVVADTMRHPPAFPPGTSWGYSNTGYLLLGMVIQRVTGRPWYREVDARVLRPLHLDHTRWPGDDPSLPSPHAHGYQRFTAGGPMVDVTDLVDADASGGLLTTPADLDRFMRALLGGALLRPAQQAELETTVPVDARIDRLWPGARYGLGLFSRPLPCGGRFWLLGGDQVGWSTRAGLSTDGRRGVVVSASTQHHESERAGLRQEAATTTLIDHALCGSTS